ncbi:MAG: phospho-sugar mutase [Ruminococcaceae bacterium]|nr:phospho-sugar mutase [Oscillospiraceae bacterium]
MNYKENYNRWLTEKSVSQELKDELIAISNCEDEIKYRFSSYLSFGTAGLRGKMLAGTNAMNVHTVAHASQGFANLINREGTEAAKRGVVIAYDSRNNSVLFSRVAAEVFAANGIKTYFFESLRPTPVLSFAIRHLGCIGGVNVTASHNPKEYNGYKAYWEDGAQLPPEHAKVVSESISETDIFNGVKRIDFDKAVESGLIEIVGTVIDDEYIKNVTAQAVDKNAVRAVADDLRVVYTPLHGAGYRLVPEVLRLCGLKHLYTVYEQMVLDGNFPSVISPNPEHPAALELGTALAKKVDSDLVIGTDPDADRAGVMVRRRDGSFVPMTGNQIGALLLEYIITAYKNTNTMPSEPYAVKTIVTSEICTKICESSNVQLFNVLTGFKFIGEVIKNHDDIGNGHYLFGFEESYGYLKGTYARDKDSVVAVMLIVEMAAYYKAKGMSLYDALIAMYEKYGYYNEKTVNLVFDGFDAAERMSGFMKNIRSNIPAEIGGKKVLAVRDYLAETVTEIATGKVTGTGLPASDVVYFELEDNNVVVVRPSGTEPKVKLYFLLNGNSAKECEELMLACAEAIKLWK